MSDYAAPLDFREKRKLLESGSCRLVFKFAKSGKGEKRLRWPYECKQVDCRTQDSTTGFVLKIWLVRFCSRTFFTTTANEVVLFKIHVLFFFHILKTTANEDGYSHVGITDVLF